MFGPGCRRRALSVHLCGLTWHGPIGFNVGQVRNSNHMSGFRQGVDDDDDVGDVDEAALGGPSTPLGEWTTQGRRAEGWKYEFVRAYCLWRAFGLLRRCSRLTKSAEWAERCLACPCLEVTDLDWPFAQSLS